MTPLSQSTWHPTTIEIRGFLGVGDAPLTIDLDRPVTVLVGANGSGKSTILEAIEWALFGVTAVGTVGEEMKTPSLDAHRTYIHRGSEEAYVRLQFSGGERSLTWQRTRHRVHPRPTDDVVSCSGAGADVDPDPEELFGVTADLFRRAVAPAQGALQALTSGDKTKRDATLDRLFGIEQLNDLTLGLGRARFEVEGQRRRLRDRLEQTRNGLRAEIARRFDERTAARAAALEGEGTAEMLSPQSAAEAAASLAQKLGVAVDARGGELDALREASSRLRSAADSSWTQAGPGQRETRLLEAQQTATVLRDRWQKAVSDRTDEEAAFLSLVAEVGCEQELEEQVITLTDRLNDLETRLSAMNARIAVVSSARSWIAAQPEDAEAELACPVCERPMIRRELAEIIDAVLDAVSGADGEAARLQALSEATQAQVREVSANNATLRELREQVETLIGRERTRAADIITRLREHDQALPASPDELEAPVAAAVREALLLGVAEEPDASSSPTAALNDLLHRIAEACDAALQRTQGEIAQIRETARAAREKVLSLERVVRFLEADARLSELDSLAGKVELAAAEGALEDLDSRMETLQAVIGVADSVSQAEADARITALAPRLASWFESLSGHDSLRSAKMVVTTRRDRGGSKNSYAICATSADGWEAGTSPLLSGGYQTALAVAALCALSDDEASRSSLGLLALDEPTQSLDREMSRRLGRTLVRVNAPRLLITTTEEAFVDDVLQGAGSSLVRVIRLAGWTAAEGTRTESGT